MTGIPEFQFNGQIRHYRGKVRDVYYLENDLLVMVVSDRISAFDVVLPKPIPYKGQVLNQLAAKFLDLTSDIIPNWKLSTPDPSVTIGKLCDPFPVEMVIRGFLAGHAWREYRDGKREICGVNLPDGLKENDKLPEPIITPTTKAHEGHDEDISKEEIFEKGLVSESDYRELEKATRALFERGSDHAQKQGLILVDTKYEFGKDKNGTITLIDEIHTPDSSRYFYADGYEERQQKGESQKQLSKEFVRKWLIENNFQGRDGDRMPEMTPEYIESVSERYIELFEKLSGDQFKRADNNNRIQRIEENVSKWLAENS
jgi:phosphoribosylaminoimidazole-succinocarboxamide synthase